MFQTKTLYVEMYVNIETEKYEDIDELMKNTKEAISLYLKCKKVDLSDNKFFAFQQIEM